MSLKQPMRIELIFLKRANCVSARSYTVAFVICVLLLETCLKGEKKKKKKEKKKKKKKKKTNTEVGFCKGMTKI